MKIAITGGAGFIGTQLAKLLHAAGHDLVLIDLKPSPFLPDKSVICDVTDAAGLSVALKGADAIYHLAAEHRDDVDPVQKYYDVNVGGGKNVIAAAREHGIRKIIFTSSVAVYPLEPSDPETGSKEEDTAAPFNDYGQSKLDSEKTFFDWANEDDKNSLTVVRLVATFGKDNRGNIYTLMNQIAGKKFIMIGDGSNCKSVAYVGNVAAFLEHALVFGPGPHLYNYADKPDLNMREMVADIRGALGYSGMGPQMPYVAGLIGGVSFDVLAKLSGRKFPISLIRVKKFCANTIVSAEKLDAQSGFERPYSLREGLKEMIEAEFVQRQKAA